MSILASDVITTRVRAIMGTALSDQYPSDAAPLAFLSDALRLLYGTRPDAAVDDDGNYNDYAAVTTIGQSIPISVKWLPYLTDYVLSRMFQIDGANEAHQALAVKHAERAKEELSV